MVPRPSGDWGSLPLEGGIEAAYKRQLDATESPEARDKLMSELLAKFEDVRSPTKTAHQFGIEEIIDPRDTRPLVCEVSRILCFPISLQSVLTIILQLVGLSCIYAFVTPDFRV